MANLIFLYIHDSVFSFSISLPVKFMDHTSNTSSLDVFFKFVILGDSATFNFVPGKN